jgi:hypothetical protein
MQTPVAKKFKRDAFRFAALYFVVFLGSFALNAWKQPGGWLRVLLALLPVLPIVGVIVLMVRYLRDETDEYKREVTMRCVAWGAAGAVSANLLEGYLRIFGWQGCMPPFTGFWAFFVFMAAARVSYMRRDKARVEE